MLSRYLRYDRAALQNIVGSKIILRSSVLIGVYVIPTDPARYSIIYSFYLKSSHYWHYASGTTQFHNSYQLFHFNELDSLGT